VLWRRLYLIVHGCKTYLNLNVRALRAAVTAAGRCQAQHGGVISVWLPPLSQALFPGQASCFVVLAHWPFVTTFSCGRPGARCRQSYLR
jgi:hypothetical protein